MLFADFVKKMETGAAPSYQPLRMLVQPYLLRRLKTDKRVIADLPDKTEVKAFCGLTRQQAALYEQTVRELEDKLEEAEGIQRRGLVLAQLMRLKQVCNHPAQMLGHGDYDPKHSGKLQRLAELGEELAEYHVPLQEIIASLHLFEEAAQAVFPDNPPPPTEVYNKFDKLSHIRIILLVDSYSRSQWHGSA